MLLGPGKQAKVGVVMGSFDRGSVEKVLSPFREDALRGKVALITGGGSGIGLEIARQFGKHGANLCIMGRRQNVLNTAVDELRGLGIQAIGVSGDVRKREDADNAVNQAVEQFGRLDILVNGAAGNFLAASEDLSSNAFRTVLDIDAVGTFTMCSAARKYLQRGGRGKGKGQEEEGGSIINISATLHYTAMWYQVHVSAAKAAVDSTTRTMALEWGTDYGIRSNAIAPGPIANTPGMAKLAPTEAAVDPRLDIPLGRMGAPWDIAMAALFLSSDAGRYINGATIVVDGGGWLFRPRHLGKEVVQEISRKVERRSRVSPNADKKLVEGPLKSRL